MHIPGLADAVVSFTKHALRQDIDALSSRLSKLRSKLARGRDASGPLTRREIHHLQHRVHRVRAEIADLRADLKKL
jgi:polyhydroxyalkanoate synthesis regulator phasin